jgi:hypothetical protein
MRVMTLADVGADDEPATCLLPEGKAMLVLAASSYPLLNVFWTMLIFVGFFIWIWLLIAVFADIFRSHDMHGLAKALWVIGIIILPLLGVLIYLIARGPKMAQHAARDMAAQEDAQQAYIRSVAGDGGGPAEELTKLAGLRDSGVLTQAEFEQQKARVLAQS